MTRETSFGYTEQPLPPSSEGREQQLTRSLPNAVLAILKEYEEKTARGEKLSRFEPLDSLSFEGDLSDEEIATLVKKQKAINDKVFKRVELDDPRGHEVRVQGTDEEGRSYTADILRIYPQLAFVERTTIDFDGKTIYYQGIALGQETIRLIRGIDTAKAA